MQLHRFSFVAHYACLDGQLHGVIIDADEAALEELNEMGMSYMLECVDEPPDEGIWRWSGSLVTTYHAHTGDYDTSYEDGRWELVMDTRFIRDWIAASKLSHKNDAQG